MPRRRPLLTVSTLVAVTLAVAGPVNRGLWRESSGT